MIIEDRKEIIIMAFFIVVALVAGIFVGFSMGYAYCEQLCIESLGYWEGEFNFCQKIINNCVPDAQECAILLIKGEKDEKPKA